MNKKIFITIFALIILLIPTTIFAKGSATVSCPTSTTVGNNVTFTVRIQNTAAWNLKLSVTGATNNTSKSYADVTDNGKNTTKNLTLTCKATKEGTITFTVIGDITSEDGVNSEISMTKTINVTKAREKETESRLSNLSVNGYEIQFDKDIYEYTIVVEPETSNIEINAKAISKYAKIEGIGSKEITEPVHTYEVVVTAENGDKKNYKINVVVKDNDPINIEIQGKKYTIVKSDKLLTTPSNFTKTTIKINNYDIPAFINEKLNMTLVGITNSDGNIYYAVYKDGNYKLFNKNSSSNLSLYIVEAITDKYPKTTVTINDEEYPAYTYNDRFVIVYAMNLENGEYNYYKYDTIGNTFQVLEIDSKTTNMSNNVFIILTIILFIIVIALTVYIIMLKLKNENNNS